MFFSWTVAPGTGVPSGRSTEILRWTIAGGSGTVMDTVPVSPTRTVIEAAWRVAPDASRPPVVAVDPGAVVVVVVGTDGPMYPGIVVVVGGAREKVTGPDGSVDRALPEPSVASVLDVLLDSSPGASGAVHRTLTPVIDSPEAVLTEIETDERVLRLPETTVNGM